MADIEDAPRLRELCERASKEFDHDKLIDLIRQINELLERRRRRSSGDPDKQASPLAEQEFVAPWIGFSASESLARIYFPYAGR